MMFFETLLAPFSVSSAVRIFSCLIHLHVSDAPCFAFASRMLCSVVASVALLCIALLGFFSSLSKDLVEPSKLCRE